jgi:hypothetical protein
MRSAEAKTTGGTLTVCMRRLNAPSKAKNQTKAKNQKSYERTRQVIENKQNRLLGRLLSRQLIENNSVILAYPVNLLKISRLPQVKAGQCACREAGCRPSFDLGVDFSASENKNLKTIRTNPLCY